MDTAFPNSGKKPYSDSHGLQFAKLRCRDYQTLTYWPLKKGAFTVIMTENAGLTEVYRGEQPVVEYVCSFSFTYFVQNTDKISIVAVHGLNGHPFKTWTTHNTSKFWLGDADLLPFHLKQARILTFGYNAAVTSLLGKTSSDRIMQHAQTLIAELVADREASLLIVVVIAF